MNDNLIVDLPDMDEHISGAPVYSTIEEDKGKFAIKLAFLGSGQGGCNIAAQFYKLGYGKVLAINTTEQDLRSVDVPHKFVMVGEGGAGKSPEIGLKAIKKYREEVLSHCRSSFGEDIEQIIICVGAGGGTGTGTALELVEVAKDYLRSLGREEAELQKCVGVITTMPQPSEGSKVCQNAHQLLVKLVKLAKAGQLSPLVLVDNARISKLYPNASVKDFYNVANKNLCAHFSIFNQLAAQDSKYATFDVADYRSILRSGLLLFGHTKINSFEKEADISDHIRLNLQKGLFCEGFDLHTAPIAAGILVASDPVLGILPQTHIDLAFTTLNRLLDTQSMVHRGIYETTKDALFLYTIIGGLNEPTIRLQELKRVGGL